jgi:hypothetical protein
MALVHRSMLGAEAGWGRRPLRNLIPDARRAFKANGKGRHHIAKHKQGPTNWPAYEASLRQHDDLTVWFSEGTIAASRAEPRTSRGGQSLSSSLAILTALTHQRGVVAPGWHHRVASNGPKTSSTPVMRICTPIHSSRKAERRVIVRVPVGPINPVNRSA